MKFRTFLKRVIGRLNNWCAHKKETNTAATVKVSGKQEMSPKTILS